MTAFPPIALLGPKFENHELWPFDVIFDQPANLRPFDEWLPNFDLAPVGNKQHLFKLNLLSRLQRKTVNLDGSPFFCKILLAAMLYNCVFHRLAYYALLGMDSNSRPTLEWRGNVRHYNHRPWACQRKELATVAQSAATDSASATSSTGSSTSGSSISGSGSRSPSSRSSCSTKASPGKPVPAGISLPMITFSFKPRR